MCRSIKPLRPPMMLDPTTDDIRAAALQYVRKVTGFREPSKANQQAFREAVDEVARATDEVLARIIVRGAG